MPGSPFPLPGCTGVEHLPSDGEPQLLFGAVRTGWPDGQLGLYPGRVSVVAGNAIVASNKRVAERGQVCYDWEHDIPLVQRKPGALHNGASFADMPAPLIRLKQGLLRHAGGDRMMAQVLAAVPTAGLAAVLVAVERVVESGVLSAEHVENVLARLNANPIPPSVETSLQLTEAPVANTGRYVSLRVRGVMDAVEADHA